MIRRVSTILGERRIYISSHERLKMICWLNNKGWVPWIGNEIYEIYEMNLLVRGCVMLWVCGIPPSRVCAVRVRVRVRAHVHVSHIYRRVCGFLSFLNLIIFSLFFPLRWGFECETPTPGREAKSKEELLLRNGRRKEKFGEFQNRSIILHLFSTIGDYLPMLRERRRNPLLPRCNC